MSKENIEIFSNIADNYDTVNRIISLGMDIGWRRKLAHICLSGKKNIRVLDAATGTADIPIIITEEANKSSKRAEIVGMDYTKRMLDVGKQKVKRKGFGNIKLVLGDAHRTGLRSNSFDCVTTGFALRNFDNLQKFINESYRILKPGGSIVFLEVSRPEAGFSAISWPYYHIFIPFVGMMYSRRSYAHLVSTVWKFDKDKLGKMAEKAGFTDVKVHRLFLSVAFIFIATKPG